MKCVFLFRVALKEKRCYSYFEVCQFAVVSVILKTRH
jgi:hypothetical protein